MLIAMAPFAAWAGKYDQDLIDAVAAGKMTAAQAGKAQEARDDYRMIIAAGEESGYLPCLRGAINERLPDLSSASAAFKRQAYDNAITGAEAECEGSWKAFITAFDRRDADRALFGDIFGEATKPDDPAVRKIVHDFWLNVALSE